MQSWYFRTLLPSAILFILSAALTPAMAFAAEPADANVTAAGEVETSTTESGTGTWDKTREVSGEVWDATKEGSAKAWETTKEVSGEAWEATKEGSARAWDKTREFTMPEAGEQEEAPQPDPQVPQP